MTSQKAHMHRVGEVDVIALWDGPLTSSFDKIPDPTHRAEAERLLAKAPPDALTMNVYGFLLRSSDGLALIDTGAGGLVNPNLGKLASALDALGVDLAQVKRIFMTHAHRDHYGGLVDADGKAAFPNAELVFHRTEASFWLDSKPEDMPRRAQANLESLKPTLALYAGRIRRIDDGESIASVSPHLAPGHTPGHTCWLVQSNGQSLLAWGDTIHISYIHLPAPHVAMEYDLDPGTAKQSRLRVLDWVARDRIPVAGAHLPSPGIGTIEKNGDRYEFRPDRP